MSLDNLVSFLSIPFTFFYSSSIKRARFLRNRKYKLFDNGKHSRITSQIRNRTPVSNYKMIYKFSNHIELVQQLNKGGLIFNVLKRVNSRIYKKQFNSTSTAENLWCLIMNKIIFNFIEFSGLGIQIILYQKYQMIIQK